MAQDPRESSRRGFALRNPRSHSRKALGAVSRSQATPTNRSARRSPSPVRSSSAPPRPCSRDGPRGRPLGRDPASARTREPRDHLDLPAGDRQLGDHRHRSFPASTSDLSHSWSHPSIDIRRAQRAACTNATRRPGLRATRVVDRLGAVLVTEPEQESARGPSCMAGRCQVRRRSFIEASRGRQDRR